MKSKALIAMMCALSLAACASTQKQLEKQRERDPKYQYNLGLVHLNNPQISASSLDEAIRYFDKALSLDPRLYLAWNARGLALTMRGDLSGAIRSFEKCLEINPAFSEAHNNLGSIYESQGLLSKAEEAFKKPLADKSYPTKELPLYNLARMAFLQ